MSETKKAIAEAFLILMQKKSIDKITVKDVSDACGMARQSFYYHFQDILELVEWMAEQALQDAVARSLEIDDPVDSIEQFISMAVNNYEMIKKLLASQRYEQFQKILTEGIRTYLLELTQHKQPDLAMSRSVTEDVSLFYACGIAGLLLTHAGDKNLDTHKLSELIYRLLSGGRPT